MKLAPLTAIAVALTFGGAAFRPAAPPVFQVVVNAENPVTSLPKSHVARLFLRRATWPSGALAIPCDLAEKSQIRIEFTRAIHGKSVSAVKSFWQQQIFAGRDVPPPEKSEDAEVFEFVLTNPSAIGYVSGEASLPEGVRALEITE